MYEHCTKLVDMLLALDIDSQEVELIKNLYWDQQAAVRYNGEVSKYLPVKRGVRQGCIMSPDLFSLYTELIMRNIKEIEGFSVGGININNLRYADDTAIRADSEQKQQRLMDVVVEESGEKGLDINKGKSFVMVFSKKADNPNCNIDVRGDILRQVKEFQYLGSWVTSDGKSDKEIKRRIGMAKTAYKKMEKVLASRSIKLATRLRLLKCYIWSVLLYGAESWTISKTMQDRLQAAEMWFVRRMLRISWTDRISNEQVLSRAGTHRQLIKTIITRQIRFLGHVLRKEQLEDLALTGKIEGRRSRGRQRLTYLGWMQRATGIVPLELIRRCKNREEDMIVANVRI